MVFHHGSGLRLLASKDGSQRCGKDCFHNTNGTLTWCLFWIDKCADDLPETYGKLFGWSKYWITADLFGRYDHVLKTLILISNIISLSSLGFSSLAWNYSLRSVFLFKKTSPVPGTCHQCGRSDSRSRKFEHNTSAKSCYLFRSANLDDLARVDKADWQAPFKINTCS